MTTTQKQLWANRAAKYEAAAKANLEKAAALVDARSPYERDIAFLTQPGMLRERDKMRDRFRREHELRAKAEYQAAKAENLRIMASRNKGDAEAARQAKREATVVAVGDIVDSLYGRRVVVKVNAKTVRLEGVSAAVDKAHVKIV